MDLPTSSITKREKGKGKGEEEREEFYFKNIKNI